MRQHCSRGDNGKGSTASESRKPAIAQQNNLQPTWRVVNIFSHTQRHTLTYTHAHHQAVRYAHIHVVCVSGCLLSLRLSPVTLAYVHTHTRAYSNYVCLTHVHTPSPGLISLSQYPHVAKAWHLQWFRKYKQDWKSIATPAAPWGYNNYITLLDGWKTETKLFSDPQVWGKNITVAWESQKRRGFHLNQKGLSSVLVWPYKV